MSSRLPLQRRHIPFRMIKKVLNFKLKVSIQNFSNFSDASENLLDEWVVQEHRFHFCQWKFQLPKHLEDDGPRSCRNKVEHQSMNRAVKLKTYVKLSDAAMISRTSFSINPELRTTAPGIWASGFFRIRTDIEGKSTSNELLNLLKQTKQWNACWFFETWRYWQLIARPVQRVTKWSFFPDLEQKITGNV